MSEVALHHYNDFTSRNNDQVIAVLEKEFSVASLMQMAMDCGYEAEEEDWGNFLSEYLPHSKLKLRLPVDNGEVRELDLHEVDDVQGGMIAIYSSSSVTSFGPTTAITVAYITSAVVDSIAISAQITAATYNMAWTS